MRACAGFGMPWRRATSLLLVVILAAASIAAGGVAARADSTGAVVAAKKKCKKAGKRSATAKKKKCKRKPPGGTTIPGTTIPGLGTTTPARGPTSLSITPTSHDFGTVHPEDHSAPQSFLVTNTGPNPASPMTFTTEGENADEFHISHDLCSGRTLLPGGTCTLDVEFVSGLVPGPKSGSLRINGPPATPVSASLSGFTGLV
jgi:hypothetical protein